MTPTLLTANKSVASVESRTGARQCAIDAECGMGPGGTERMNNLHA